ncbi:hypothetical protein AA958_19480 [Streptomyces sp. CNQ-509]|nr:hypothetical protein AA958_19480 [Streptomyces sp. CNQ-509]
MEFESFRPHQKLAGQFRSQSNALPFPGGENVHVVDEIDPGGLLPLRIRIRPLRYQQTYGCPL